jgi:dolichol-phosphate mannosyltransferase
MAKRSFGVSFIVPALNEERVIEKVIRDIWRTVDPLLADCEIILVNDGSTDRTGEIMDSLATELPNMRVLHNRPNRGLGASYQAGVAASRLEYVMMLCGDGGLPASSLPAIIEKIGSADIVVPYMLNLKKIKSPTRYLVSRAYTLLLNFVSRYNLRYYNGLPVHRRRLLEQITITSSGFGFQGEILIKLLKSGCSYVEVPVLGAEFTNNSSALRLKNVVNVTTTLVNLVRELRGFAGIQVGPEKQSSPSWSARDTRLEPR